MSGRHEQISALLRHMPNRRDVAHAYLLKEEELEAAEARLAALEAALREIAETVPDGGPAFLLVEKARCAIGYAERKP